MGLTSVTIPNSVRYISDNAFEGCTGLTSIEIPNSVTTIYNYVFNGCTGLSAITIPSSVTTIGQYAFEGCTGLTSIEIPNSVENIYNGAFSGCTGLTSVVIPNSVTTIGNSAFLDCTGLTEVTFNAEKCTSMGTSDAPVFKGCDNLVKLSIGEKVTKIPKCAFTDSNALIDIVSAAPNPPICGNNAFRGIDKAKCTLTVLEESVEKYKAADEWKDFLNINGYSGVDEITVDDEDAETLYDVYNMQGVKVGTGLHRAEMTDALPHGVYILVSPQGTRKEKI